MARAKQDEMFEQKKVSVIEKWSDKFDEKRELIGQLEGEMDNAELKLLEAMHANIDSLDKQQGPKGETWWVYERGDYRVILKEGKERINVKIRQDSKGSEPEGGDAEGGEA